jgi:hypothetical protein
LLQIAGDSIPLTSDTHQVTHWTESAEPAKLLVKYHSPVSFEYIRHSGDRIAFYDLQTGMVTQAPRSSRHPIEKRRIAASPLLFLVQ